MKKLMIILCSLAVVFSFAACSETQGKSETDGTSSSKVRSGNLQIVDTGGLRCSSEKGYYYIGQDPVELKDGSQGYLMMYMDYETKKEIYLCNRPGCEHNDESCPAVFSEEEAAWGGSLFYYDDHLYLFSHEQDQSGGWMVNDSRGSSDPMEEDGTSFTSAQAVLYRMNPDGTDRKKVYTFDEGLSLENHVLASGNSLFFVTKKVSNENVNNQTTYFASSERELIELDTEGWNASQVCKLDTEAIIIGAIDNKLVLVQTVFDHKLSNKEKMNDAQYIDAYKKSYSSFVALNIDNGKTEEIATASNDKTNTYAVSGKYLYLSTEGKNKIECVDLKTKEKKTLAETSNSCIYDAYEDVLHCTSWSNDGETDTAMYFVHLDDGRIEKSGLQINSMGGAIAIQAELADQFFALYDYDAKKDPVYEGQYNLNGAKFALIAKDDLYGGKANYKTIKMISSGLVLGE